MEGWNHAGHKTACQRVNNTRWTPQGFSCVMPYFVNGLWMDCKRIVNGYEWICIRLYHSIPLQTLSETQLTKKFIINFKNFQGNETKSQSHQVRRTAAKQIGYVSVSYRFRIDLVSIPYRSRIVLLSFSYRSRFRKRKQYGNDTETIEEAREKQGRMLPTQNIFNFLKLYNYGKTQWYLNQTSGISR